MAKPNLTAERLRELLVYQPDTGFFIWRVSMRSYKGKVKPGVQAGNVATCGYLYIGLDGKRYLAHRLAWFYTHGHWPSLIDHINRIRIDDRIDNLRIASRVQNGLNAIGRKNSISGVKGVQRLPGGTWRAVIKNNYRMIHIGCFATMEEASHARKAMEEKIFSDEACRLLREDRGALSCHDILVSQTESK